MLRRFTASAVLFPHATKARRGFAYLFLFIAAFSSIIAVFGSPSVVAAAMRHATPVPSPTPNPPTVINFQIISAARGAAILRSIYPYARFTVDSHANAVVVVASGYDEQGMHSIASGIDVKNPTDAATDTYQLKVISPETASSRLSGVFPGSRILVAPNKTIIITATPTDMAQIKAIVAAIDSAPPTPTPKPRYPAEAVRVTQRDVKQLARAVAAESPTLKVAVSGSEILLSGPPEDVDHAKQLIAAMDVPQMGTQYTQVYRLKYVDATSVGDLFERSFSHLPLAVDTDLNAITVTANLSTQRRIADAIAQLDVAPAGPGGGEGAGPGGSGVDVVSLRAAVPGLQGGASTSATDIANAVTQTLQASAPDLHIVVPANSTQLILSGSPYSVKLARELIEKLDVAQPLVAMDTEVLEVDEGVQKQLGIKTSPAVLTTFTEINPAPNALGEIPPLGGLQPFGRTALAFTAQLDMLINENKARILENPRITTVSGRTASLHAGETVNILTTAGGGVGTVATTQVQSFQTGVSLDITPVVNDGNYITVSLHPSVNTIAAVNATTGVPNIQTRDTTTTVGLRDGDTLVIGGLLEEEDQRSVSKIPILGDIPLIGRLFQDHGLTHTRNELIVTVTPHIVQAGDTGAIGENRLGIPKPQGLPTLPPGTQMPPPHRYAAAPAASTDRPPAAPEPAPVNVPIPRSTPQPPAFTPPPGGVATASPQPLPSAFSQTNVFTYGAAPQNNYAAANQNPQIFYAQVSPSVVRNGQMMTITAITTTNVTKLAFGPNKILAMGSLKSVGPGQWEGSFPFSPAGLQTGQPNVQLLLTATTGMGGVVSIPVPMSVISQ